jgi:hypothetical protein
MQQYCLHAVYMQVGTGNFIPKKEAISCQARICDLRRRVGMTSPLRKGYVKAERSKERPPGHKKRHSLRFQGLPWGIDTFHSPTKREET